MPADRNRPLAIIVVNYGSVGLLADSLVRTVRSVRPDCVVVVDNRTTAEERQAVRQLTDRLDWMLVAPERNLGFGGGMNLGVAAARRAGARDFLLLNPDAVIERESVDSLRGATDPDGLAMLAPVIRDPQGAIWFAGADVYLVDGAIRSRARRSDHPGAPFWEWLSGACLLIQEEAWDLVGGFDEEYFLYWEDVDLSRRLVERGGRISVVPHAEAVHDEGGTQRDPGSTARAKSALYYYYNIRNRMLFASKHLDAAGVRRWQRKSVSAAWEVLLRGGRRQFLQPAMPVIAAWRGLRDAQRIVRNCPDPR